MKIDRNFTTRDLKNVQQKHEEQMQQHFTYFDVKIHVSVSHPSLALRRDKLMS